MKDFVICPTHVISISRERRIRAKRKASEAEAFAELLLLQDLWSEPPSIRFCARSFGWSPGRLRNAILKWQALAPSLSDPSLVPIMPTRRGRT